MIDIECMKNVYIFSYFLSQILFKQENRKHDYILINNKELTRQINKYNKS